MSVCERGDEFPVIAKRKLISPVKTAKKAVQLTSHQNYLLKAPLAVSVGFPLAVIG